MQAVLYTVCFALLAPRELLCIAKRVRPGNVMGATHLVAEVPKLGACDVPGNSIQYYNVAFGVVNKYDFVIDADFNISRSIPVLQEVIVRFVKCRDSVSSNTCEHFQTWRIKRNVCQYVLDRNTIWRSMLDTIRPPVECPSSMGHYRMRNFSIASAVLGLLPLPWEGNVWLVRFSMMQPRERLHHCTDIQLRVHRVRE